MQLGLLVEAEEGLTWPAWRALYRAAEGLGFESVWISDHLGSPWHADARGLEAWSALAVAAAETRRVQLGPLVSPVTFRPPGLLARMAQGLYELSAGRFALGLGLGWNRGEHEQYGIPFPAASERARLLEEAIVRARELVGARLPILVGGSGPRSTLPLVARFADEWNLTTASPAVVTERSAVLAELCRAFGREPASIRRSIAVGMLVGRDSADLRQRCARMQTCVPPLAEVPLDDVPRAARAMGWLSGTVHEVAGQLRELGRAGVDRAMLGIYDHGDMDLLRTVAEDVAPRLN